MDGKIEEVARDVIDMLRLKQLTVAEIREVLTTINEVLDDISVLKEKPHTAGTV